MAKIFENSQMVNKLAKDDPECSYVNKMMGMSADFLRQLHESRDCFNNMHGVVPTNKLPEGYSFGKTTITSKDKKIHEFKVNNITNHDLSISKHSMNIEYDESYNETYQVNQKMKMIETVKGDFTMSEDENHEDKAVKRRNHNHLSDNEQLLFETLDACSKNLPSLDSMLLFQKHYRLNQSYISDKLILMKDCYLPNNESSECKANLVKHSKQDMMRLIDSISTVTYIKNLASSFEAVFKIVNDKKRKIASPKCDEKDVSPPKRLYQIHSSKDDIQLTMYVIPNMISEINLQKLKDMIGNGNVTSLEVSTPVEYSNLKHVNQDSLPFKKMESTMKKDVNTAEDETVSIVPKLLPSIPNDNSQNSIKKPEAVAKQFFAQSANYSNYGNSAKVAVVEGKVNTTQPSWQIKTESDMKSITTNSQINSQKSHQKTNHNQSSQLLNCKDDSDESKVVQGLKAMKKMRSFYKNDFITRMRNLEIEKWLKEVNSLKEKAMQCKTQLDYAPQVMVFIRKNLFYNYSLEVKSDYAKSHHTYLENAAIIKQSCLEITNLYKQHEENIIDKNSARLWNIKLVKYYTVAMCHRISAILQFRAFRNVADDCQKLHDKLVLSGVIEKTERTNQSAMESQQTISPFSILSSYSPGQVSIRNSSPHFCNSGNQPMSLSAGVTLTAELKSALQRYVDQTNIINSSYNDWNLAEKLYTQYCKRSAKHEDSWGKFEWKIIEKTGGVVISGIDESVPFVIKYLEGYINFMSEFMKHSLS